MVNKSLGNILRSLVGENPNKWDKVIDQAEFSYNDSPKISTRISPFQVMYGTTPERSIQGSLFGSIREKKCICRILCSKD